MRHCCQKENAKAALQVVIANKQKKLSMRKNDRNEPVNEVTKRTTHKLVTTQKYYQNRQRT